MIGKSISHYRILGELSMGGVAAFRLKREGDCYWGCVSSCGLECGVPVVVAADRDQERLRRLGLARSQRLSQWNKCSSSQRRICFHSAEKGDGSQDLYGDGLWSVLSVSDLLLDPPLPRRLRALWGDWLHPTSLLHPLDLPHCPGRVYRSIGVDNNLPCLERTV